MGARYRRKGVVVIVGTTEENLILGLIKEILEIEKKFT